MWKNSTELFEHALRELRVAASTNKNCVEIVLHPGFSNNSTRVKKFCNDLKIKEITELLREEFSNCNLKSEVVSGNLSTILTFKNSPCQMSYILKWKLTLRPKSE